MNYLSRTGGGLVVEVLHTRWMQAGKRLAVPHQGELVPEGLAHPLHVSVSPAEEQDDQRVLVMYPLPHEGHVMSKKSQIHLLIFIILEKKQNEVVCFHLSGSNDAMMLTVASCCVYSLVKWDCQCVYERLSLFTCTQDGGCVVRLLLAAFHRWRRAATRQVQC